MTNKISSFETKLKTFKRLFFTHQGQPIISFCSVCETEQKCMEFFNGIDGDDSLFLCQNCIDILFKMWFINENLSA